jgi:mercuric ion binding protein
MRRILFVLLAGLPVAASAATPQTVTLAVQRMTCSLCPVTIKKSLEKVTGVSAVTIDFGKKTATVTYDPDKTTPDALAEATTEAGYPSTVKQ